MDLHAFLAAQPWLGAAVGEHVSLQRAAPPLCASLHVSLSEQQQLALAGASLLGATAPDAVYLSFAPSTSLQDPMQFAFDWIDRNCNRVSTFAPTHAPLPSSSSPTANKPWRQPGGVNSSLAADAAPQPIRLAPSADHIRCLIDGLLYALDCARVRRIVATTSAVGPNVPLAALTASSTPAKGSAAATAVPLLCVAPDRPGKPPYVSAVFDHVTLNVYPPSSSDQAPPAAGNAASIPPLAAFVHQLCEAVAAARLPGIGEAHAPEDGAARAAPAAADAASGASAQAADSLASRLGDVSAVCCSGLECQAALLRLLLDSVAPSTTSPAGSGSSSGGHETAAGAAASAPAPAVGISPLPPPSAAAAAAMQMALLNQVASLAAAMQQQRRAAATAAASSAAPAQVSVTLAAALTATVESLCGSLPGATPPSGSDASNQMQVRALHVASVLPLLYSA